MSEAALPTTNWQMPARVSAAAGFAVLTAGSAVVAYFDPTSHNFFPVCPLYAMTGFACPGCGLTRGFHALFHGDTLTALDYTALIPVWAAVILWVWISLGITAIRGKGLPMWPTKPNFLWAFFIALMIFGVLRNIPVYPLSILFP
jgi:hypothetical protein